MITVEKFLRKHLEKKCIKEDRKFSCSYELILILFLGLPVVKVNETLCETVVCKPRILKNVKVCYVQSAAKTLSNIFR